MARMASTYHNYGPRVRGGESCDATILRTIEEECSERPPSSKVDDQVRLAGVSESTRLPSPAGTQFVLGRVVHSFVFRTRGLDTTRFGGFPSSLAVFRSCSKVCS